MPAHCKIIPKTFSKKDLKKLMRHLRLSLTGQTVGPSIFDVMEILGKDKVLQRVRNYSNKFFRLL